MSSSKEKDRPVVEATLESGEIIADVWMRGEVLAEIPIIGTAIKICKAADSISDRMFAIKLARFVQGIEKITDKQKLKLKEKMGVADEQAIKVGETLLLVLEQITDLDKPLLLSQIFIAYIDGIISSAELRRLSQSIDAAFFDDIQKLLTSKTIPEKSEEPWMQYLSASGLTRLVTGQTIDEMGRVYFEITPLAQKLRSAYAHGESVTS